MNNEAWYDKNLNPISNIVFKVEKVDKLPRVYSSSPVCFRDNSCGWCSLDNRNNRPGLNSNSDPGPGGGEIVSAAMIHHHNIGPVVTIMVPDHAHTPLVTLVTPVTRVQDRGHVPHLMGHVYMVIRDPLLPDYDHAAPDPGPAIVAAPVTIMVTTRPEAGGWEDGAIQDNGDPQTRHRDSPDQTDVTGLSMSRRSLGPLTRGHLSWIKRRGPLGPVMINLLLSAITPCNLENQTFRTMSYPLCSKWSQEDDFLQAYFLLDSKYFLFSNKIFYTEIEMFIHIGKLDKWTQCFDVLRESVCESDIEGCIFFFTCFVAL